MKKVELSQNSEKKIVLLYLGAKFKGINLNRNQIANILINSASKNLIPSFYTLEGDCFTVEELMDFASDTLFYALRSYLYEGNLLSNKAKEFFRNTHYCDKEVESKLIIHVLNKKIDFECIQDVDAHAICKALLLNEEYVSQGIQGIKDHNAVDIDSAYRCHRLIKMVIRDYRYK